MAFIAVSRKLAKFFNKQHFALPANHTVSLCAFWVWEYSFCLFFFRFAFAELNYFHDEFATHFAWRFLIYFSIQISLISLCSPWENSVTDHINTVLTKSEFQLSPASPVAQSDVSIRQLSVTVSFVRRNWFTSDKKVVFTRLILAPYSLEQWNSLTDVFWCKFDSSGSQVNMQRRLWFMQFDQWCQLVNFTLPSCGAKPLSLSFGNLFVSMKDTIQVC